MLRRFATLLLLTGFLCVKAVATTFTVTSNADSGTGTLREALTLAAANGNTEKDFIYFNLPDLSEVGRTIILQSALPTINSDMSVDGSSQAGSNLSVNGAKIILQISYSQVTNGSVQVRGFYLKNVDIFELYSFVIKGQYRNAGTDGLNGSSAIIIDGTNKKLIIGQLGKGNVLYDVSQAIECTVGGTFYYPDKSQTDELVLESNFIGVKEDGVTIATSIQSACSFPYIYNVTLGGPAKLQGNVFYGKVTISPGYLSDQLLKNVIINVRNNIFGANALEMLSTDPAVTNNSNEKYLSIGVQPNQIYNVISDISIQDNVFGCTVQVQGFQHAAVNIKHNFFGTSSNLQNALPIAIRALSLLYMQGTVIVGGLNSSDGNTFTNCVADSLLARGDPVINVQDFGPTLSPNFRVELSHNSFYCNGGSPFAYAILPTKKPVLPLSVDNLNATSVNGTAVPNARIELYYTDKNCTQCQPKTYITSVQANSSGQWGYNGILQPGYGVIASATFNSLTSEFTDTRVYDYDSRVTNATCGVGGSITGLFTANAKSIQWVNLATHQVVGNDNDLLNVVPGKYRFKADQFGCVKYSMIFEVGDNSPTLFEAGLKIIQPSCAGGGSITDVNIFNTQSFAWFNENGNINSSTLSLENLPVGSYKLVLTGSTGCIKTFGPFILKTAVAPQISQANTAITPSPCGQFTGSIKGITITSPGTLTYSWKTQFGTEVSTELDLINKPGGKYRLTVTSDGACTAMSTELEIPETNSVSLNTANGQAISASCEKANGSIIGLQATGATQITWTRKADNVIVGNLIDLKNIPAGDYVLTLKNTTCSKNYDFNVGALASSTFGDLTVTVTNTCDAFVSGKIEVNTDNTVEEPAAYRWVNSAGANAAFGKVAQFLAQGTYKLYLTNKYGCENFYKEYTVGKFPPLVNAVYGTIINIICGIGRGSVSTTTFTGGTGNYIYQWYDADGAALTGKTDPFINNLSPGKYTLTATDGGCSRSDIVYTILDKAEPQAPPVLENINLLVAGTAVIKVKDPYITALYRLYDSADSNTPIDEQRSGLFDVNVTQNRSFYVALTYGYCESERVEVKVSIDPTANTITNTFTPNGDGVNDYWKITGLDGYSNATVTIYTRSGKIIFHSKGYVMPFDGNYQGKALPSGVYYYTIRLTDGKIIAGNLTILR